MIVGKSQAVRQTDRSWKWSMIQVRAFGKEKEKKCHSQKNTEPLDGEPEAGGSQIIIIGFQHSLCYVIGHS